MQIRNYSDADFTKLEYLLKKTKIYYKPLDTGVTFRKKIKYSPRSIIVAEDYQRIVGTVFIILDHWCSFIYHLCVHPDYRGKKLATKLMDEAESRLKSSGIKYPTLFVEKNNKDVLGFYKKRGWYVLYEVMCLEKKL